MMKFLRTKKGMITLLATLVVAASAAVGAYAYFTANGTGTGSAQVGNPVGVTLAGTITGTLYPAGTAASVSILVTNSGSGAQTVGPVHLASITTDAGHSGCDLSASGANAAFTMPDTTAVGLLGPGASTTVTSSLQMNDTGVSQNPCAGAPLTLNLTSN